MIPDAYETLKADLEYSYRGVFTPDDVAEAVDAARALLEPRAHVETFLPVLVARQAREQLMAKAQAEGRVAKKVPEVDNVGTRRFNPGRRRHSVTHPCGLPHAARPPVVSPRPLQWRPARTKRARRRLPEE